MATKILVIGNSFGTDCTRYLYGVARSEKVNFKVVNLFIGGCSLYRHYRNMLSEEKAYDFELNGFRSGLTVSLKEALLSDEWDFVFMQQCSPDSGDFPTYEPYATELASYVRKLAPKAKLAVHQTWTFETGAERFKLTSFASPEEMFPVLVENYAKMKELIRADVLIPDGEAMYTLWQRKAELGIRQVHRDTFHADLGVGRYLLALTVFAAVTGRSIRKNTFSDFDVEVTPAEADAVRAVADEVARKYGLIKE